MQSRVGSTRMLRLHSSALTPTRCLTLASFVLLGCPDAGPSGPQSKHFPVPTGQVALADWNVRLAQATCSHLERCQDSLLRGLFYRNEPCVDYFARALEDELDLAKEVAEGRMRWDAARFDRCAQEQARAGCDDPAREACTLGMGALDEGEPCVVEQQCRDELYCDNVRSCGGTCRRPAPLGADCTPDLSDDQCERGTECLEREYCEKDEGNCYHCVKQPKRGQECDDDAIGEEGCGSHLTCEIWDGYDHTGSCEPRKAWPRDKRPVDAGCDGDDLCLGGTQCRPRGLSEFGPRNNLAYFCKPALALGERCLRTDDDGPGSCEDDAYCDADAPAAFGVCVSRVAADAACRGDNARECPSGQRCEREDAHLQAESARTARRGLRLRRRLLFSPLPVQGEGLRR